MTPEGPRPTQPLPEAGIAQLMQQVIADLRDAGFPPEATAVAGEIFTRALHRVRLARRPRPPRPLLTPNGHGDGPGA